MRLHEHSLQQARCRAIERVDGQSGDRGAREEVAGTRGSGQVVASAKSWCNEHQRLLPAGSTRILSKVAAARARASSGQLFVQVVVCETSPMPAYVPLAVEVRVEPVTVKVPLAIVTLAQTVPAATVAIDPDTVALNAHV